MGRNFQSYGIEEIEKLFANGGEDPYLLTQLLEELGYRKTKRARQLMSLVAARLADFEPDEDEPEEWEGEPAVGADPIDYFDDDAEENTGQGPDQLWDYEPDDLLVTDESENDKRLRGGPIDNGNRPAEEPGLFGAASQDYELPPDDLRRPTSLGRFRPPGTRGLPDPWVRPLNQDRSLNVSDDAGPADLYIAALGELIAEIKRTGAGQKRYELENGVLVDAPGGEHLYAFPFVEEADLFEDAQVEVEVSGQRVRGTVVSITQGKLLLVLGQHMGEHLLKAILLVDATALLEALKEKIEQVKKGELSLNRALADAVVGFADPPPDPVQISGGQNGGLKGAQLAAFKRSISAAVSFIWGPPGCGKTYTLARVVKAAFDAEKRILICSNTNKAVDQVLFAICQGLGIEHPALEDGKVVRLGRVTDDKLQDEFSQYVTVDGIVERKSAELNARKREIEEEIARIDALTARARHLFDRFLALDSAERDLSVRKQETEQLKTKQKELLQTLDSIDRKKEDLQNELYERRNAFFAVFKRKELDIQRDLDLNAARRVRLIQETSVLKSKREEALAREGAAIRHRDGIAQELKGQDRNAVKTEVERAENRRGPLVAELQDIDTQLSKIRDEVIRQARVLGATCTKGYLSAKEIGQVDMVIVDEASMVIAPAVWFCAGLSRERVIICGDFRQIPPIVQTNQQSIFDVLGKDPFELTGLNEIGHADSRLVMLDEQRRMTPAICNLISGPMYAGRLSTEEGRKYRSLKELPEPFAGSLTVVDTSDLWPFESVNAFFSRFNLMHALLVRNLTWQFWREGYVTGNTDVGVCTPYAAQAKLTRKLLDQENYSNLVQVGTVHSLQGDERNTIILEIPESHGGGKMLGQFVQGVPPEHVGARLINVAVSRAEDHLVIVANLAHLDRLLPSSSLLRDILFNIQEEGGVVPGSQLLSLRPIESDLKGLIGRIELDVQAEKFGIFNQDTFDSAIISDIRSAKESIVVFSGFVTPRRVAELGDLLRAKRSEGVRIRCVTRPPQFNGTMPPELGKQALDALEGIGCVVDCRAKIHEKVVLIDREIVWHGSLNALSHAHNTDESMTRLRNPGYAQAIAGNLSKRHISAEKAILTLEDAENPRCPSCGHRTMLLEGKYGPFFRCEDCDWREDMKSIERKAQGRKQGDRAGETDIPKQGPACPKCGSKTVLRIGRYGPFYGCTKYPDCTGIVKNIRAKTSSKKPARSPRGKKKRATRPSRR